MTLKRLLEPLINIYEQFNFLDPQIGLQKKTERIFKGIYCFFELYKNIFQLLLVKVKIFGERASFQLQKLKKYKKYKNAIKKGRKTAQKFLDGKGVSTPLKLTDFFKKNVVQNDFSFKNTQYT